MSPCDVRRIFRHVARLDAKAAGRVGRFVAEAESIEDEGPFPLELLAALRRLVPCDRVIFSEMDRVAQVALGGTMFPVDGDEGCEPSIEYWDARHEHPICHQHEQSGDWRAHRISDFVSARRHRASRIYAEWFRPLGIEHEITVGLDAPLSHTKVFLFDRQGGRDFTAAHSLMLDALRPYLARRYRIARTQACLRSAQALLDRAELPVVLLEGREITHATPQAHRLLERYAPSTLPELPTIVLAWLAEQGRPGARDELVIEGESGSLVIRVTEGGLLLEERAPHSGLTPREREILELVAEGRTNAQIAEQLWISAGTVRRHLENAYAKLGVHTRTAAVRAVSGGRAG